MNHLDILDYNLKKEGRIQFISGKLTLGLSFAKSALTMIFPSFDNQNIKRFNMSLVSLCCLEEHIYQNRLEKNKISEVY